MASQMTSLGLDGETPEATPEGLQAILGEPLRECLVEMVDECLRHKDEGVEAESYFANVLEPLFREIASGCIDGQPEDPVEFVQEWVEEKLKAPAGANSLPTELLAPLPCLQAWCERQLSFKKRQRPAMEALQGEVASLRKQLEMLNRGLGLTPAGQQMLAAAAAGDQGAFDDALAVSGLVQQQGAADNGGATSSPSAAEAETAETMGEVLRALRMRGMMSASAAFQHFQPGEDGCISSDHLLNEINSFGGISPRRSARLVSNLDRRGSGRVDYRDFRSKISSFLATSREFHPSLSADELQAIMTRIRRKLQQQGLTVSEAFREWDADATSTLECSEFMAGLRSLHLGLSGKEVAQVFNAMTDADGNKGGMVSLHVFETSMLRGAKQNRLKDWALASFARFRETLELGAVEKALRHYSEQPEGQYMHYSGFTALASDTDPGFSSVEIGKLWCVLDKEDGIEEPSASIEELLHWMAPHLSAAKVATGSTGSAHSALDNSSPSAGAETGSPQAVLSRMSVEPRP